MPQKRPAPPAPSTIQRDASGRIVAGSGALNPGGRPKGWIEALRKQSLGDPARMASLLASIIEDGQGGTYGPRERWDAIKHWLAYQWGRPVESLTVLAASVDEAPDLSLPLTDLIALARRPKVQTVDAEYEPAKPSEPKGNSGVTD